VQDVSEFRGSHRRKNNAEEMKARSSTLSGKKHDSQFFPNEPFRLFGWQNAPKSRANYDRSGSRSTISAMGRPFEPVCRPDCAMNAVAD
jgi:hypothetical protein